MGDPKQSTLGQALSNSNADLNPFHSTQGQAFTSNLGSFGDVLQGNYKSPSQTFQNQDAPNPNNALMQQQNAQNQALQVKNTADQTAMNNILTSNQAQSDADAFTNARNAARQKNGTALYGAWG